MTTEQKAKAYDEAITTAKQILSNNCSVVEKLCIECVFPELKESEDERVKRCISDVVRKYGSEFTTGTVTKEKMLAWLEKQGQVKESINSQHENKTCKGNGEFLTSEDERIRKGIIKYLSWIKDRDGSYMPNNIPFDDMIAWLERQKPSDAALEYLKENHSPSEVSDFQAAMNIAVAKAYDRGRADAIAEMQVAWSEEDEEMFEKILQQFMAANNDCKLHNASFTYDKEISFLKFLKGRVQPKQ